MTLSAHTYQSRLLSLSQTSCALCTSSTKSSQTTLHCSVGSWVAQNASSRQASELLTWLWPHGIRETQRRRGGLLRSPEPQWEKQKRCPDLTVRSPSASLQATWYQVLFGNHQPHPKECVCIRVHMSIIYTHRYMHTHEHVMGHTQKQRYMRACEARTNTWTHLRKCENIWTHLETHVHTGTRLYIQTQASEEKSKSIMSQTFDWPLCEPSQVV